MNLKKMATGTAMALVIGVSAIAGLMNAGIANADELECGREATMEPTRVEVPKLTLTENDAWQAWHKDFVIDGTCAD